MRKIRGRLTSVRNDLALIRAKHQLDVFMRSSLPPFPFLLLHEKPVLIVPFLISKAFSLVFWGHFTHFPPSENTP